ncbi:glyoxalase superfamily protein [Mesorhizobium sp. 1M-11]|uniref:glyoxalase superfamily protein n=1 Tax=Mesorhizobium sp. 1M-11 TaxID=1529006 RepID=UPI0006C758AB|nr:glyoxalase superfamily protein [Mesorhizobium sp. 1M-11]
MRDYHDAKSMAQTLRGALGSKAIAISHGESLELVSKMFGFADWNTLSAKLQGEREPSRNGNITEPEVPVDERGRKLAEQAVPRVAIPFDPRRFDEFAGYYEQHPGILFKIYREGGRYLSQITGQGPVEIYPENETKFFATVVQAQISFVKDAGGRVTELILHQNGLEMPWKRIDKAVADRAVAALEERIKENRPQAGSEDALRRLIDGIVSGHPNYDEMGDELAQATREQLSSLQQLIRTKGGIKFIRFVGVTDAGDDVFHVEHENRLFRWSIGLDAGGKVVRSWVSSGG